jgi:hypothetical protein
VWKFHAAQRTGAGKSYIEVFPLLDTTHHTTYVPISDSSGGEPVSSALRYDKPREDIGLYRLDPLWQNTA